MGAIGLLMGWDGAVLHVIGLVSGLCVETRKFEDALFRWMVGRIDDVEHRRVRYTRVVKTAGSNIANHK